MIMPSSSAQLPGLLLDGIHAYTMFHPDTKGCAMSVLYIDVVEFSRFEENYGQQACNQVLDVISDTLRELLSQNVLPWPNLQAVHIWDDGFAILVPHTIANHQYTSLIHDFVLRVEQGVNRQIGVSGYSAVRLRYGLSPSLSIDDKQPSEQIYQLMTSASRVARRYTDSVPLFLAEELHNIIVSRNITSYYQPIMELHTWETIGWESLARGPIGSRLERPVNLFGCAERLGHLLDVERVCRDQAIRQAKLMPGTKLFINLSPKILADASFRQGETRKVIEEVGLQPGQIVFEITEHHAIDDYGSFITLVGHYREQGYQIAIDDVGAGHSGLITLMQVKPDFVKIDMELIRDIDKDPIKQDIVRAIHQISAGFSGTVIAEGIETPEELECIRACGVQYGQGFLLGKPSVLA